MSDDKFDAIVVGAGVAGSVAALVMARAGLDVLVIERGDSAGCKNMTGGRLYAHTLEAIIPGFAASAPIERKVTREKISFLTEESAVTLDFHREQPDVPQHASYTVLRNRLDPWLSRILLQLDAFLLHEHPDAERSPGQSGEQRQQSAVDDYAIVDEYRRHHRRAVAGTFWFTACQR